SSYIVYSCPLSTMYVRVIIISFFFFQAEDGIRDFHVTGVQTCALPISWKNRRREQRRSPVLFRNPPADPLPAFFTCRITRMRSRSEERRVGKECRSRWSP